MNRALLTILSVLCGLGGFALIVVGIWMMHPPAALVVGGVLLCAYGWLVDRAVARLPPDPGKKG